MNKAHTRIAAAVFLSTIALTACGSSKRTASEDEASVPHDCEQYLSSYQACLTRMGRRQESIAGTVRAARTSLAAAAAKDPASVRSKCAANLAEFELACPGATR